MSSLRAYCSLAQLRRRQELAAIDTSDDAKMLEKIRSAAQLIEAYTGDRVFQPVKETRTFDYHSPLYCSFRGQDLLTLTSITDGTGGAIPTAAMIMLGGHGSAYNSYGPFYGVELDPTMGYFLYITTKIRAIAVTGVWGFHDDYANAWVDSGDTVQNNPLTSGGTTLTVSNYAGADSWGRYPRISPGNLLQIESEWLQVLAASMSGTISLTGLPSDGDSFTIGVNGVSYVYTFKTTITATTGQVLIGATPVQCMTNLLAALLADTGQSGSKYSAGTTPLPLLNIGASQATGANTITLNVVSSSSAPTLAKSGTNLAVSAATLCTSITVQRGANGSTAASHVQGTAISVYETPADIREIATRWAAFIYAQDQVNFSQSTTVPMGGVLVKPSLPSDIIDALSTYMRNRVN